MYDEKRRKNANRTGEVKAVRFLRTVRIAAKN
jgi:hypothetical protein